MSGDIVYTGLLHSGREQTSPGKEQEIITFEAEQRKEVANKDDLSSWNQILQFGKDKTVYFLTFIVPHSKQRILILAAVFMVALFSVLIGISLSRSVAASNGLEEINLKLQATNDKQYELEKELRITQKNFSDYQDQKHKEIEKLNLVIASHGMQIKQLTQTLLDVQTNVSELRTQNEQLDLKIIQHFSDTQHMVNEISKKVNQLEVFLNETTQNLTDTMLKEISKKTNQIEVKLNETTDRFVSSVKKLQISTQKNFTKLRNSLEAHINSRTTKLEQTVETVQQQLKESSISNEKAVDKKISTLSTSIEQSRKKLENKVEQLERKQKEYIDRVSANLHSVESTAASERLSLKRELNTQKQRLIDFKKEQELIEKKTKKTLDQQQRYIATMNSPASRVIGNITLTLLTLCISYAFVLHF